MTADHLSYSRATSVSLIGFAIQAVLAVIMLIYSRLGQDPAAMTAALIMLLALPIWVVLALVFHQHKLERLEALEAQAFATSGAAGASVFEGAAADQQVQAGKLAWMHKWFLPVVGLLFGGAMIGVGIVRFMAAKGVPAAIDYKPPTQHGWAVAIGVGCAVIGFIFARFVAGMAKQKVWMLLHAGSGAAVGSAIVGLALTLAHFLFVATGKTELLRVLPAAVSVFMIGLGGEAVLNFVFNLYRPRKSGDYLRPAFDSRCLAFIAAPDRLAASISEAINYQIGFNVSSTWFYRLVARSVGSFVLLGLLVMWLLTAFSIVKPNETGLLLVNGRLSREVAPGLVIKYPWPFASVVTFPSSAATELLLGSAPPSKEGPILWTTEHSADEKDRLFIVQPTAEAGDAAGDLALIAAELPIHYIVRDLKAYLSLAQDDPGEKLDNTRQQLLAGVAWSAMIEYIATKSVEDLLGPERQAMRADLQRLVQAEYDRINAGVEVIFVGLAGVHPEQSVAPAFEAVVQKDQRREAELERARAAAIRSLAKVAGDVGRARDILRELDALEALRAEGAPENKRIEQEQRILDLIVDAGGEAATLISEARAYRWERHMGERARVVRSRGQIASYRAAPQVFRATKYLEALAEAARDSRVYITPFNDPRIELNKEEVEPNISALAPTTDQGAPKE